MDADLESEVDKIVRRIVEDRLGDDEALRALLRLDGISLDGARYILESLREIDVLMDPPEP